MLTYRNILTGEIRQVEAPQIADFEASPNWERLDETPPAGVEKALKTKKAKAK